MLARGLESQLAQKAGGQRCAGGGCTRPTVASMSLDSLPSIPETRKGQFSVPMGSPIARRCEPPQSTRFPSVPMQSRSRGLRWWMSV